MVYNSGGPHTSWTLSFPFQALQEPSNSLLPTCNGRVLQKSLLNGELTYGWDFGSYTATMFLYKQRSNLLKI